MSKRRTSPIYVWPITPPVAMGPAVQYICMRKSVIGVEIMLPRVLVANLIWMVTCSVCSWGQQQAEMTSVIGVQEFPVVFQNSVTAGRMPVGTKIQAKLLSATLLHGNVLPRGAKFSGEVVVSQAKTRNQPSLLSVRMDSIGW